MNVVVLVMLIGLSLSGCATGLSGREGTLERETFTVSVGGADTPDGKAFSVSFRDDAPPVERVLLAPVDTVWAELPGTFTDLGYMGGPSTRAGERLFVTPSMTIQGRLYDGEFNSEYFDCGRTSTGTPAADDYEVNFAILAGVTPVEGGSTRVKVLVGGRARSRTQSSNTVHCAGTGRLEAKVLQRLQQRVTLGLRGGP